MKFRHHDQMLLSTVYTGNGPICIYNYVPGMQYEGRGRVVQEVKVISGSGTFRTEWWYNSADLVTWMKYPSNNQGGITPQVDTTYHPQKLVNSVASTTTYVKSTSYDAAGRVELRELGLNGANPVLKVDTEYFPWNMANGQGRLKYIRTGTPGNPTSLQDLRYYTGNDASPTPAYDAVGNILNIYDHKAGSPQTQTFTYKDGLNRLTSAAARRRLTVAGLKPRETWLLTKRSMSRWVISAGEQWPIKATNWARSYE